MIENVPFALLLGIKVLVVLGLMLGVSLVLIYAELKWSAHIQSRVGPWYVGGRWGWAHPLAEAVKFLQKEDLVPEEADDKVFRLAPYVMLAGTVATFVVIPIGPEWVARNLDVGIFYLLAISSLSTLGVLMAGWGSGNKYSLIGGVRAGAQLIAYELPLVLALVAVAIQAGTLSLTGIVEAQATPLFTIGGVDIALPYVLSGQIIGFVIFVIASLAELNRTPFDLPLAESELTMGYVTEYSGLRFTMFFLGEYAGMVSMAAIVSTVYLGGYWMPGLSDSALDIAGPFILLAKIFFVLFLFIWFRWTWPRIREDQLQGLAWKWLIPLTLFNIIATATLKVVL
ncbi:MAG: NADH-quinone oxidoreductase subunit NuoH [Acidimicrobiia bacterium]|nr:NADH-quinone oxidoreductase subunit NuoH [Acidimicrobiia bacterium]